MARAKPSRASTPRPSSAFERVGLVDEAAAPFTAEIARRYGVSSDAIRRRAYQGTLRVLIDSRGRLRFPIDDLPRQLPPAYGTTRARGEVTGEPRKKLVRKKKKRRAGKRKRKKKAGKRLGKRRKKVGKKRPPRPPRPPATPRPPAPPVPTGLHGPIIPDAPAAPPISRETPMPIMDAARQVAHAMRDFIMSRSKQDRAATYADWYAQKTSFRQSYGKTAWRSWVDWMIDEYELEDFVMDREALRDS